MKIQFKPLVTVLLATNLGVGATKSSSKLEKPSKEVKTDTIFCDNIGFCSIYLSTKDAPFERICSKNLWRKPIIRTTYCNASTIDRQECLLFHRVPYPVTVTKFGRQDVDVPNVLVVTDSHTSKVFKRLTLIHIHPRCLNG